ncbi:hypothetical protein L1987_71647 [Smallanthus sonchifolius]|uniref:Uncharacterized protein n=1 Tax=Smallanthus sonchifolius TaxID=185202 RepID=A0ACB9AT16_9ASTR|nr:hypothetical protein L1987_71647 [Smallanthus sonchifolius]
MILHILIFSVVLIITSAEANCNRVCRGGGHENSVSYPFGFSDACEIPLKCSEAGEIRVGEYIVQNITSDHIRINLPAKSSGLKNNFNLRECDDSWVINRTINCYSEDQPDREEFINLKKLEAAGCRILLSSVTADVNGSSSPSVLPVLDYQKLELGWWVRGECGCDKNAACRNVSFENQTLGYRCHCNNGYAGDGFIAGDACRRGTLVHYLLA